MTLEGYSVIICLLVVMTGMYILGRMRGYRKGAKAAREYDCIPGFNLTCKDAEEIERIVKQALAWALGYDPDYEISDSVNGLARHWVNALQLMKCEIISEVMDRVVSETAKTRNHITQEIKAQDKRAIKREAMRAARAKEKTEAAAETVEETEETTETTEAQLN